MSASGSGALGAILAGGKGTRMGGAHKGLIEVDGVPLIRRAYDALIEQCEVVVVIAYTPEVYRPELPEGCLYTSDRRPGHGAPGGVHTALCVAEARGADRACVLACDLPSITAEDLRQLSEAMLNPTRAPGAFYEAGGRLHPLAGWWGLEMLPDVEAALDSGAGLQRLIRRTDARIRPGRSEALLNFNTPQDLRALKSAVKPPTSVLSDTTSH